MKPHRKARTTLASRFLLVSRVEHEEGSYADAAEGFGVTERTVGNRVQRFRRRSVAALADGASLPGPPAQKMPAVVVDLIGWLREHRALLAWAAANANSFWAANQ